MIIGLTGYIGSGKGTVAEYLASQGYRYISCREEFHPTHGSRQEYIDFAQSERESKDNAAVMRGLLQKADLRAGNLVIDDITHPEEIAELKKSPYAFIINIEAPQDVRRRRLVSANDPAQRLTPEEFERLDTLLISNTNPALPQLFKCRKAADYNIVNEGTVEELKNKVDEVLKEISTS